MRKQTMFLKLQKIKDKIILKKNVDFLIFDFHGEITSEKMAIGHFFDGFSTAYWNSYSCSNCRYKNFRNGTAYQTDIGMCGDYNSVIGMNKEIH